MTGTYQGMKVRSWIDYNHTGSSYGGHTEILEYYKPGNHKIYDGEIEEFLQNTGYFSYYNVGDTFQELKFMGREIIQCDGYILIFDFCPFCKSSTLNEDDYCTGCGAHVSQM